jgi:hypothetical protein
LFVHDADPLVWMYRTCSSGRELTDVSQGELDRYIAYRGRIKDLAALTDEIVADLDGAIGHLADTSSLERGNQSTLALRCTIDAAASAYVRLFGKAPGRSRADYRTFGRFVSAIIDRIPKHKCPPMPSASAISDVVEQWHQRRPVA